MVKQMVAREQRGYRRVQWIHAYRTRHRLVLDGHQQHVMHRSRLLLGCIPMVFFQAREYTVHAQDERAVE